LKTAPQKEGYKSLLTKVTERKTKSTAT